MLLKITSIQSGMSAEKKQPKFSWLRFCYWGTYCGKDHVFSKVHTWRIFNDYMVTNLSSFNGWGKSQPFQSFNPGPINHELFNPRLFNHEFLNNGVEKFMVQKSGVENSEVEMSSKVKEHFKPWLFNPRFFNHELFNPGHFNRELFNPKLLIPRLFYHELFTWWHFQRTS